VRWIATALKLGLMPIIANNWAIYKGASKLAHSRGFAFDKKYAALGETQAQIDAELRRGGSLYYAGSKEGPDCTKECSPGFDLKGQYITSWFWLPASDLP
jgi:hypothetical protein